MSNIKTYYTDDCASYPKFIPEGKPVIGKQHTHKIKIKTSRCAHESSGWREKQSAFQSRKPCRTPSSGCL
jgi:IS1 family transposase